MKKLFLLVFITWSSFNIFCQTTEEDQIKTIRKWFAQTNENKSKFKSKVFDLLEMSTDGAKLIAYYDNNQIALLEAQFFGETGNITYYAYYNEGNLYFVFSVTEQYTSHIAEPDNTVASTIENRYYFWDNKMIRWLDNNKKQVDKKSASFKSEEQRIREIIDELYELAKNE